MIISFIYFHRNGMLTYVLAAGLKSNPMVANSMWESLQPVDYIQEAMLLLKHSLMNTVDADAAFAIYLKRCKHTHFHRLAKTVFG